MRLIDADAMNEELFYEQTGGKDTLITCEAAFDMIKAQPTVYDIDKVVDELNKASWKETDISTVVYIDDAIKIVKNGGASDDVCVWIKYDYLTMCPKNHDVKNPYWRIPMDMDKLKYCPYCGKKINVVDK